MLAKPEERGDLSKDSPLWWEIFFCFSEDDSGPNKAGNGWGVSQDRAPGEALG